ncbi:TPA: restriction endonuclease subunit S [Photobacterium damselae]
MTGRYKAYTEYKDSGIEWLKQMPSHWELVKAKHLFQRVQRPVRPQDGIVTAFRDGEVTLRSNRRTDGFTNAAKEIGYQGVRKGDLLVHAMDGFAGAIGISDSDGKCSPVCSVCIPRKSHTVDPTFFGYLVRQLAVTDYITSLAKGIRERSTEFRFAEFSSLFLAAPPREEQQKIANFLDHETAKIDTLITKQEKLIELLKEKRQVVISHAVTKGLNPDAPMKDSGVEWLGEVPEHWDVSPLKHHCELIDGDRSSVYPNENDLVDTGVPFVSSKNIVKYRFTKKNLNYITKHKFNQLSRGKLKDGDLVITVRGTIGHVALFDSNAIGYPTGFINAQMMIIRLYTLSSRFLMFVCESNSWKEQMSIGAYGSTVKQLSNHVIGNAFIAIPPVDELVLILNHLEQKVGQIDDLLEKARVTIDLMRERKTALISAAVTGKIDVRDWETE